MQTVYAIGCLLVILLIGVPFAITHPWRVAMVVCFFLAHVLVGFSYDRLLDRLRASRHPAARRFASAHAAVAGLLTGEPPYDGPERRIARGFVQTVFFLAAAVFYVLLLVWLGGVLDWLENQ